MDDEVEGDYFDMRFSIGLTMLLCASACSSLWAADLHALEVKPGQWETTTTGQMTGVPAIPPEVLAKLTPEQRAKMESAMGARGAKPIVSTSCRTKEKLAEAWTTGQTNPKVLHYHVDQFLFHRTGSSYGMQSERNEKQRHHKSRGGRFGAHSRLVSNDYGDGRQPPDEHELFLHVEVVGRGLHRN
jgi:Protein of unknown function (DUF3617)